MSAEEDRIKELEGELQEAQKQIYAFEKLVEALKGNLDDVREQSKMATDSAMKTLVQSMQLFAATQERMFSLLEKVLLSKRPE